MPSRVYSTTSTASAYATWFESSGTDTDVADPITDSATGRDKIVLYAAGTLQAVIINAGGQSTAAFRYSTNSGTDWATLASVVRSSVGVSSSISTWSTFVPGVQSTLALRVQAYVEGDLEAGEGHATSKITQWYVTFQLPGGVVDL